MARCVAIVLLLISPNIFSEAAGNIGCLFSETLCNQETEWCYDDYAFGRCLPLYGNIQQENMFRYNLGTGELHALEKEMQRLFQLGYRWSHTYTQCVLQILLNALRDKSEFDISSCNSDLDQDLEGALKAIEGEEVDHIDPRNLAIVRFSPSVADPHSDYADEFYFPPVNEILPPYRPNEHDERERAEKEAITAMSIEKGEKGRQSGNENIEDLSLFIEPKMKVRNMISDKEVNDQIKEIFSRHPELSAYSNEDPIFRPVLDDYDDGYTSYASEPLVMPLIHKRANILERRMRQFDPESAGDDYTSDDIFKKLLLRSPRPVPNRNLGEIMDLLSNFRNKVHGGAGPRVHVTGEPVYSPTETDRSGMYDYPDTRFRISEDSYNGRFPSNSFMSGPYKHEKTAGYVPFVASYDRSMESPESSQIPELEPPDKDSVSYISDEIHPRYEPPTSTTYLKEKNPESYSINNIGEENSIYENSVSRFDEKGRPVDGKELLMEINAVPKYNWPTASKERIGYPPNQNYDPRFGHNLNYQINHSPPDYSTYYYSPSPYSQYFDYDYDYDYYQNPAGHMDPSASGKKEGNNDYIRDPNDPYNLERSERVDEKKPGPPFMKLREDSADGNGGMGLEPESLQGGGDWMRPMTKWMQGGIAYPIMNSGRMYYDENDLDAEGSVIGSDGLQFDEAVLDGAGDVGQPSEGQKERLPMVAKQVGHSEEDDKIPHEKDIAPEDSYIYITINGEFPQEKDARQLIDVILHYARIEDTKIEDLSVKKDLIAFKLWKMPQGMSPAELAEKIEDLRPIILEKTRIEIMQAGIVTKTGLSGVVQKANDRQMEAAAAIVCGVCGALLVSATALFLLRRHAKSKAKLQGINSHDTEASKDYQSLCRARMAQKSDCKDTSGTQGHGAGSQVATQRVSSLSKESDNGNNSPSSRSSTSSWSEEPVVSNMDISTGHMVLSYMEDHLKNKDRLDQEWVELCSYEAEPCASNIALKGDNAKRNRYQDCVPYDHNRVVLNEHTNINASNYINASSITDHDPRNPAYIATQGPLNVTSADFWQLVWEQGSVVIVMLTRLTENCQSLCHRYWPEEGSELYHIYEVHLVSEHIWCDDYLVRSFYLKNVKTGETRTVTQFHFLSWPESGTPASTKALLEFRRKVNKSYRGRSCPIIVHCSDGVGRTGTYCLIDMVLNRMVKGSKEIDIAATLEHIRDQRPVMVKTKSQFEFVLMAVAEEVHAILKALPQ